MAAASVTARPGWSGPSSSYRTDDDLLLDDEIVRPVGSGVAGGSIFDWHLPQQRVP